MVIGCQCTPNDVVLPLSITPILLPQIHSHKIKERLSGMLAIGRCKGKVRRLDKPWRATLITTPM
jgi:hypothetical protein